MKEIKLQKNVDMIIGALRVDEDVSNKISKMAEDNNVSKQDIIRSILKEVIDEVTFK